MIINFWGREIKANVVVGAIGAFFVAVASSMFGFGGGPFMVPLMTVVLGLPMYVVVGSSLLAILFNTLMATSKNLFFETVDFKLFAIMAIAAVIGGYLGPQIAKRISPVLVKRVAVVLLLALATQLFGWWG
ncbi:MAG: sulfite exporter TauE/SafE family protein [Nitrospirota bacterium]